jgi:hypothetical protein
MPRMRPAPPDEAERARIAEGLAQLPDNVAWYSRKFTWRRGEVEPIPRGSYVILTDGRAGRVKVISIVGNPDRGKQRIVSLAVAFLDGTIETVKPRRIANIVKRLPRSTKRQAEAPQ